MKKAILNVLCIMFAAVLLFGCAAADNTPTTEANQAPTESATMAEAQIPAGNAQTGDPNEEYVFACMQSGIEYWNQHRNAMYDATTELGVKYSFYGTEGADANEIVDLLETIISKKPAGIITAGYFPEAFIPIFQKAWDEGIPIATTTIDVPDSKRLVFLGTNYYNYGRMMADTAAEACDATGKVIISTMLNSGQQTQFDIVNGIKDCIAEKYPNMSIVAQLEDEGNAEVVVQVVSSALQAHPDTAAIIGTDSSSGIGSAAALREVGLQGKVAIVCMDRDVPTLEAIKEGSIYATLAGKQYAEVYYAVKFLYDFNHNKVPLVADNKASNVIAQPMTCDPGAVIVTAANVDAFLEYDINDVRDPNFK